MLSRVFCSRISWGWIFMLNWCVVWNRCSRKCLNEMFFRGFLKIGLYIVWMVVLNLFIWVFGGI